MAVVLLLTTLDNPTIEYPVMSNFTLGRSSSCDLTVEDKQMSGKHGQFDYTSQGQLLYSDLGSTNGSYLNNSQIQKVQLKVDEVLRLGNTSIIIDEKRLNSKERIAIGRGVKQKEDRTIAMPARRGTKSIVAAEAKEALNETEKEPTNHKKSVVLNKDLKKKTIKSNGMGGGEKENIIEQDASSGKTKMLKLDISKHKKKP